MENIENIKNNLSNICYLYDLYRFPDMEDFLTLEYVDDVDPEELQDTLNDYFIAMTWDIPETWGLLDLIGKEKFPLPSVATTATWQLSTLPI